MRNITFLTFFSCVFGFYALVFADADSFAEYGLDLGEVVVTSSRIEQAYKYSSQNISIVTEKDLNSIGANEITEILDLLPSVDILEYGSIGATRSVHTRGASSSQVLTLLDGRPMSTPRDGFTDFNQIMISDVDRIEVLRGPASSIYGANAVGGVLNIISKNGLDNQGTRILSKFGSFRSKEIALNHGDKICDLDYFLSYGYLASAGYRDNTDYLSNTVHTRIGYAFDADNRLSFSTGYYNSENGSAGPTSWIDLDDRTESFKNYFDLSFSGKTGADQQILLKAYENRDRFEFIETFSPLLKDAHSTVIDGFDGQISHVFFDVFRTAFGLNFQEHKLNSSNSGKHDYFVKGLYAESETEIFKNGSFKFGARWDDYSNFGSEFSPSVGFNFWFFDMLKFHALAARSFRAPTFNDLYWPREDWGIFGGVEGNEDLIPEHATSYEAGFSGYLFGKFKTDVTFFRTKFRDLIEWTVDNAWWWRPENINSASIQGIEYETEFVLPKHVKANFNYTYLESENGSNGKWLMYRPQHLYKLRLAYTPVQQYEFGLNTIYKTKRFVNVDNSAFLEHSCLVNFDFAYTLHKHTKFFIEVKNIFDKIYQEEHGYPLSGRAFYAGAEVSF